MYITKNFGIVVLTIFKDPLAFPKTVLTAKARIKEIKINIVKGEGAKECILRRMYRLCVLLTKCPKTLHQDCRVPFLVQIMCYRDDRGRSQVISRYGA